MPIINGSGEFLKESPIGIAIRIPNIVDADPMIEAARPAICPIGCIASAFKFPIIRPIIKNTQSCQTKYNENGIR